MWEGKEAIRADLANVVSLFSTRVYSQDKPDQYLTRLLSKRCVHASRPKSTLRRGACNEQEPRTKRYNVRRRSLFKDRNWKEERDGKGRAENAQVVKSQFILAPKRIEAGRRGRASVAASRSGKAGMLILENPMPIRTTKT